MLNIVVSFEEIPGEGISAKPGERKQVNFSQETSDRDQKSSSSEAFCAVTTIAGEATIATKTSAIKKSCIEEIPIHRSKT